MPHLGGGGSRTHMCLSTRLRIRAHFEQISVNYWHSTLGEMSNFCLRLFTHPLVRMMWITSHMIAAAEANRRRRRHWQRQHSISNIMILKWMIAAQGTGVRGEKILDDNSETSETSINKIKQLRVSENRRSFTHFIYLAQEAIKLNSIWKDLFTIHLSCYTITSDKYVYMPLLQLRFPSIDVCTSINGNFRTAHIVYGLRVLSLRFPISACAIIIIEY